MSSIQSHLASQVMVYDAAQRATLLAAAARSIACGLVRGVPLALDPGAYPAPLRAIRATFVTLDLDSALRGCIGVLDAVRPLIEDVARNAFAAAFEDPRFLPLQADECPRSTIRISVLATPEPLAFASESALLSQLRPGQDGLILAERGRRSTFLPAVWAELPDPELFLEHLKRKAGLPGGYWSDTVQAWRYTAESFSGSFDQAEANEAARSP